jgi:ubiquinone/menaquinone biosynthesis C-methylase UbiE
MPRRRIAPIDHFGFLAPVYDRVMSAPAADRLRSLARLEASSRLLDAGGGTGRVASTLTPFVHSTCVLDLSSGMLLQAAGKEGLWPCLGAAEAMPFVDGAFDRIVAVDTFHHFGGQRHAALEMIRVLAPGGTMVVEEPDIRRVAVKLVALAERLVLMRSRFLRPERYVELFTTSTTRVRIYEEPPTFWVVVDKSR